MAARRLRDGEAVRVGSAVGKDRLAECTRTVWMHGLDHLLITPILVEQLDDLGNALTLSLFVGSTRDFVVSSRSIRNGDLDCFTVTVSFVGAFGVPFIGCRSFVVILVLDLDFGSGHVFLGIRISRRGIRWRQDGDLLCPDKRLLEGGEVVEMKTKSLGYSREYLP
jgi:hypothetical protein